jgi:ArsR family metal-binding transcriptional regulator
METIKLNESDIQRIVKRIIKESILDNWFKKNTLKTLINRSAYSYNMHDVIIKKGDDIIIWLKPFPKSSYSEEDQQYVLNIENETLSVYGRGLNNEPDSVYKLSDEEYSGIYEKIYHLI